MLALSGPVTMQNAPAVLADAVRALTGGERQFSLAQLEGSDSSVLALLLELQRRALAQDPKGALKFADIPAGVLSFAALYGVDTLLPDLGSALASGRPAPERHR